MLRETPITKDSILNHNIGTELQKQSQTTQSKTVKATKRQLDQRGKIQIYTKYTKKFLTSLVIR